MNTYNVGGDGGNNDFKLVFENGMKMKFPNVIVPKTLHYQRQTPGGQPGPDKLHVEVTLNRLKNDPVVKEFVFGELGKKNVTAASGNRANMNKSNDLNLVSGMLTSIAYSIFLHNYRNKNDLTKTANNRASFRVNLGTGLPFEESTKVPGSVQKYKENLEGTHLIKFKHPDFNGLVIELVIENALTHYVEGEVIIDLLLDPSVSGELNYNELNGGIFVICDGGAYTFDVSGTEFTKKKDYDLMSGQEEEMIVPETKEQYSFGVAKGIGNVFEEIIEDVMAKYHPTKIERHLDRKDIEDSITNKKDGKTGWIMPEGIYIGEILNQRISVYAEEMARKFISHYNKANAKSKVKKIFLAGGASKVDAFVNTFVRVLKEENYNPDIVIRLSTKPDPVFANAEGNLQNLLLDLEEILSQEVGV